MNRRCGDLLTVLRTPARMADLTLAGWDRLLPQAASAGLLARLSVLADDLGLTTTLPPSVQPHLTAARTLAARQRRAVLWEARKLDDALAATGMPVLVLKGAAYVLGELPPARGRLFADIDILVPKDRLGEAEACLMLAGWHAHRHSDYDQRYYRQWMHELPPMTHIRRASHLDVHHNLLPETARLKTRPEAVIEAARPLPGYRCLRLPALEDLVLHSATHLFHEGEWQHGLRDLADLDALLRLGNQRATWWTDLLAHAAAHNLTYPLALALRYCRRLLATPVPAAVLEEVGRAGARLLWPLRDALFLRGFATAHADCALPGTRLAAFLLYVRAHYLRMPLTLLLPHLLHKATQGQEKTAT